jgi:hypothetical protein
MALARPGWAFSRYLCNNLAAEVAFIALASEAVEVGRALELHHRLGWRVPVGVEVAVGGCLVRELVAGREARKRCVLRQGSRRGLGVWRHLQRSDRSIWGGHGGGHRRRRGSIGKKVHLGVEAIAVCCRWYCCVLLALLRFGVERVGVIISIIVVGAENAKVAIVVIPGACIVSRTGVGHWGICLWGQLGCNGAGCARAPCSCSGSRMRDSLTSLSSRLVTSVPSRPVFRP